MCVCAFGACVASRHEKGEVVTKWQHVYVGSLASERSADPLLWEAGTESVPC